MMATRFFRYLWRVNGIIILIAGLMITGILGYILQEIMGLGRQTAEQAVQVTDLEESMIDPPQLGLFHEVPGSKYIRAPLKYGSRYNPKNFSSGAQTYSTRNYLYVDQVTSDACWLFPSNQQLILDSYELVDKISKQNDLFPDERTVAFSYKIVQTDTNGDSQLTSADSISLGYSLPDGSGYINVINGMDRLLSSELLPGGERHFVVYEADGKWMTATVSMESFSIISQSELPSEITE